MHETRVGNRERKGHNFDYFCGFIHGLNINDKSLQWTISPNSNHFIRLNFLYFSFHHRKYGCILEKLVVETSTASIRYCGKRLPWSQDVEDRPVHIIFSTSYLSHKFEYFKLQYHLTKHIRYKTAFLYLKQLIGFIDTNSQTASEFSYHFLARHKIFSIKLEMGTSFEHIELTCHDGPGSLSPMIVPKGDNKTMHSISFQMKCFVVLRDASFADRFVLRYWLVEDVVSIEDKNHAQIHFPYKRFRTSRSETEQGWKLINIWQKPSNKISTAISLSWKGIDTSHILLEGEACVYGGIFTYELKKDLKKCMACKIKATEKKKLDACVIKYGPGKCSDLIWEFYGKYDSLSLSCAEEFPLDLPCLQEDDIEQVWSVCAPNTDGNKMIFLQNIHYLFVVVLYQGYSIVDLEIKESHSLKRFSQTIHCVSEDDFNQTGHHQSFSMSLSRTMSNTFNYYIQPQHHSKILYYQYSFHLKALRSILFKFTVDEAFRPCIYCIVEYSSSVSNFIHVNNYPSQYEFSQHSNYTDVHIESSVESSVTRITIRLDKCQQMTYIHWTLSLRNALNTDSFIGDIIKDQVIAARENSSFFWKNRLNSKLQSLQLNVSYTAQQYWWYIINLRLEDIKTTWKLILRKLPCEISDVYLERFSKDKAVSALYHWKELRMKLPTWLLGCVSCNLIYVSDPSIGNMCTNHTGSAILEVMLQRHTYFTSSLMTVNRNLSHSQFAFYGYR